jgi:hypothetical protein
MKTAAQRLASMGLLLTALKLLLIYFRTTGHSLLVSDYAKVTKFKMLVHLAFNTHQGVTDEFGN